MMSEILLIHFLSKQRSKLSYTSVPSDTKFAQSFLPSDDSFLRDLVKMTDSVVVGHHNRRSRAGQFDWRRCTLSQTGRDLRDRRMRQSQRLGCTVDTHSVHGPNICMSIENELGNLASFPSYRRERVSISKPTRQPIGLERVS